MRRARHFGCYRNEIDTDVAGGDRIGGPVLRIRNDSAQRDADREVIEFNVCIAAPTE